MSASPSQLLVLWDIDHTLIETRGVGRALYERAFPQATGKTLTTLANVSGRTELEILRKTLRDNGVEPSDNAVSHLAAALTRCYDTHRDWLARQGRVLPGAAESLAALDTEPRVLQSVLTGNLRDIAQIKVQVFGLTRYLDLSIGAYGDDHVDRADLVKIAQCNASVKGSDTFDGANTVLIGDTTRDVAAGLKAGTRVIGVATGKSSLRELREAGAGTVLPDLGNTQALVRAVLGDSPSPGTNCPQAIG
ncbi:HAD family hydrolase [Streptoalloteichus hindustanus]|uniref:Phosphoglycolate phosphatase, HAD superfamily n=1 Tax=Streptoalloteichus hindustanus TaxID=2017 RepID=A0A1M4Z719_STRHI|nr:HAD hydrolase-like protein [Streptoalloteichus hindustanus]SHF13811.1 Phosphoglycolate phosphatase, HAD superfamily [Streptoalloteichus hindustanus]